MKVHISLNVNDLDASVRFYSRMLGSEPVKRFDRQNGDEHSATHGYAKFDLADPPLNLALNETKAVRGDGLSHLGIQMPSTEDVLKFKKRWEESGLVTAEEMDVICCYARQDKAWVRDPDGNEWEAFTVLENVEAARSEDSTCCSEMTAQQSSPSETTESRGGLVTIGGEAQASGEKSSCC